MVKKWNQELEFLTGTEGLKKVDMITIMMFEVAVQSSTEHVKILRGLEIWFAQIAN